MNQLLPSCPICPPSPFPSVVSLLVSLDFLDIPSLCSRESKLERERERERVNKDERGKREGEKEGTDDGMDGRSDE
jgi:hypothetical protein